jgi:hypothetical protein
LTLTEVFGGNDDAIKTIEGYGQIVFHATGDCAARADHEPKMRSPTK